MDAGLTAKSYEESTPTNGKLVNTSLYPVRHNPWGYFWTSAPRCNTFDVPMGTPAAGALASDIASNALPNAGFVTPNIVNDAHNGDSNYYLTHYSLTKYYAQVLGVTPLLNGATAPDMKVAFGL